jgi:Icc-related predicted phosphoesterase
VRCVFITDLHGHKNRYEAFFKIVKSEHLDAAFLGGDLLPNAYLSEKRTGAFIKYMLQGLRDARKKVNTRFFVILGNDDPRTFEEHFKKASEEGILEYVHFRAVPLGDLWVAGYSYVPPSPFGLKDWEKYDVSRYVGPGCLDPSEGQRTAPIPESEAAQAYISEDLSLIGTLSDPKRTIYLFHSPPANTDLDRAGLDGVMVDLAPVDVHVGSEAIKRFIQKRQPRVTLHGHIHESTAITGNWKTNIGPTYCYNGAHDGTALSVIRFDPEEPDAATRELVANPRVSS